MTLEGYLLESTYICQIWIAPAQLQLVVLNVTAVFEVYKPDCSIREGSILRAIFQAMHLHYCGHLGHETLSLS